MDYGEIIRMAEANLEAKGLKNYLLRIGPEQILWAISIARYSLTASASSLA